MPSSGATYGGGGKSLPLDEFVVLQARTTGTNTAWDNAVGDRLLHNQAQTKYFCFRSLDVHWEFGLEDLLTFLFWPVTEYFRF